MAPMFAVFQTKFHGCGYQKSGITKSTKVFEVVLQNLTCPNIQNATHQLQQEYEVVLANKPRGSMDLHESLEPHMTQIQHMAKKNL